MGLPPPAPCCGCAHPGCCLAGPAWRQCWRSRGAAAHTCTDGKETISQPAGTASEQAAGREEDRPRRHQPSPHFRSWRPALASCRCVGMRAPGGSGWASSACPCRSPAWLRAGLPRRSLPCGVLPALGGNWVSRMNRRSSPATAAASAHARRPRRCVSQPSACPAAQNPPRRTMACAAAHGAEAWGGSWHVALHRTSVGGHPRMAL